MVERFKAEERALLERAERVAQLAEKQKAEAEAAAQAKAEEAAAAPQGPAPKAKAEAPKKKRIEDFGLDPKTVPGEGENRGRCIWRYLRA